LEADPSVLPPSQTPRDHHYVPQFHLRKFGHGPNHGLLWAYDKTLDKIVRARVRGTAKEVDYNATAQPGGGWNYDLEAMFARVEGDAAPLIARLLDLPRGRHTLPWQARSFLSLYVTLQFARAPATKATAEAMVNLMGSTHLDMRLQDSAGFREWARRAGRPGTDDEIEQRRREILDLFRSGELVVVPPKGLAYVQNLSAALANLPPRLFAMEWWLLRRKRFPWLVVGDNPVTRMASSTQSNTVWAGFATPGLEVMIPFSPQDLLVMYAAQGRSDTLIVEEPDDMSRPLPGYEWNLGANQSAWLNAARYVYGRSQGDLEAVRLSLDEADRTRRPKPAVAGLPLEWQAYASDEIELLDTDSEPWT
jgi:hypothetical protein